MIVELVVIRLIFMRFFIQYDVSGDINFRYDIDNIDNGIF